ncbi:MAG: FAD-dependent oxidoreductase [Burkholderiales bacterium]|nr:FAD-dependent oxidoreductase [Burkholderiales bacterium]
MSLATEADKVIETDVLIVGGGVAGCVAAVKARQHGARVLMLDKAVIKRSGGAASGMDHLATIANEKTTIYDIVSQVCDDGIYPPIFAKKGLTDPNLFHTAWKDARKRLEELERWGVTIRWDDGDIYWIPSGRTGGMTTIRFHGLRLKPQLAQAVHDSGATVLERTMGVDLLVDGGRVAGAIALNVRNNQFIVVKAKSTIVCTGMVQRIFNPEDTAPWKFKMMYHWCPTGAGDAHAMAYRAGARLVNMEFSSWYSRLLDDKTIMFGSMTDGDGLSTRIVNARGDVVSPHAFMSLEKYVEEEAAGRTPLYFDVPSNPESHQRKREIAAADERPITLKYLQDRGWDYRTHRWELHGTKPLALTKFMAGIVVDETTRTSVDGLYAAGDCVQAGGAMTGAIATGFLSAAAAAGFAGSSAARAVDDARVEAQVRECRARLFAHMAVEDGAEPLEFETKVRTICERYTGIIRSAGKLKEGISRLSDVRRDWLHRIAATNPHELMRAADCRNLVDLAEIHLRAALMREDTRASFYRADFPERNPEWNNKVIFAYRRNGELVLEKGEFQPLKPEYTRAAQQRTAEEV